MELNNQATKFFYELTPDRVLSAVEELGVRATGKIIPLNSVENRVYDVELDLDIEDVDSRYELSRIIKVYRPGRWSKEQILEEHAFIQELAAKDLKVVQPLSLRTGETLGIVPGISEELLYAIFPKVGGRILDEYSDQQINSMGRFIARMHLVARSKPATHRIKLTPETYALSNTEYLIQQQVLPEQIVDRYREVVDEIVRISDPWFQKSEYQRVHGDCHLGNILWQDDQCTFVDFDDFLTGPAVQDLWLIISGRDEWSLKQREKLINAYSELIEFDQTSLRLVEPLRALRMIHFSAWIARRWEDPAFKNLFPYFNTLEYWRDELNSLEEVLQILQTGSIY